MMERSMQQQHHRDTSLLDEMRMVLNTNNTRLVHLDKALMERSRFLAAANTSTATQQPRRRRQGGAR